MADPKRIQRKRTKGWRMPEGAVYVGRPSVWGNPFTVERVPNWPRWASSAPWVVVGPDGTTHHPEDGRTPIVGRQAADNARHARAAALAVDLFRVYMRDHLDGDRLQRDLRGRDLACWCPLDQPCHADVLLEVANQ